MKSFFLLLFLLGTIYSDKCGKNCISGRCPYCPCGNKEEEADVTAVCALNPLWNQACCKCIVAIQSSGNKNHMSYESYWGNFLVGLFQVNTFYWKLCNNGKAPCDEKENLKCGIYIYQSAHNSWAPWNAAKSCGCA